MVRDRTRRQVLKSTAGIGALALGGTGIGSAQQGAFVGETGQVKAEQSSPDELHTVSLDGPFVQRPVVIIGPVSPLGGDPCHTRIADVTTDSFKFKLEEWDYRDQAHVKEVLHYVVLQPGAYQVGNSGVNLEVGSLASNHESQSIEYTTDFQQKPILLSQAQTLFGSDAVVTRKGGTQTGANVALQEQEVWDPNGRGAHTTERVGYAAIEPGNDGFTTGAGTTNEFESHHVTNVDHNWKTVNFDQEYDRYPLFLAGMQTRIGNDPATVRRRYPSASDIQLKVEEEQSDDSEVRHAEEDLGYLLFDSESLLYV